MLKQTYRNFELILVDDGSTDETLIGCQEFKDQDSRVRYVTFIDSDDFIQVEYLDRLYHNLQTNRRDITVCNFAHFDVNKRAYLIHVIDEKSRKFLKNVIHQQNGLAMKGLDLTVLIFYQMS